MNEIKCPKCGEAFVIDESRIYRNSWTSSRYGV